MTRNWQIPRGDSRTGKFSVRVDGEVITLHGYSIAWVLRDGPTEADDLVMAGTGTLAQDELSALVVIPREATVDPAQLFFAATASPPNGFPGPFTYSCEVDVLEHP